MAWYVAQERLESELHGRDAGSKARADVEAICLSAGCLTLDAVMPVDGSSSGVVGKLGAHVHRRSAWLNAIKMLPAGSGLVIQFPVIGHTVFIGDVLKSCRRRGVTTVLLIHDLNALRYGNDVEGNRRMGTRVRMEEIAALRQADYLVTHNARMSQAIANQYGIDCTHMLELGIFDYLVPDATTGSFAHVCQDGPVVVAGNLSHGKAGYAYELPADVSFALYGPGFEGDPTPNVDYRGSLPPDELPLSLEGSYGLVWDGPEASSCTGKFGEYLRINNPHKTSLYLASGLPVVVWREAVMADFVQEHGVGLAVDSLGDLRATLDAVTPQVYAHMREQAQSVGEELRAGVHVRRILEGVSAKG